MCIDLLAHSDTVLFVTDAHSGVLDKGGQPYVSHVKRVALTAQIIAGSTDLSQDERFAIVEAALLHDVVEDTEHSFDDLAARGYGEDVVSIVRLLTRDKADGKTYIEWIEAIAESGNIGAIIVKFADNLDNSDPQRIAQLPPESQSISRRYERSMRRLAKALPLLKQFERLP